eukprot:TRINITY_DN432_c0_g1_i1.p1 TRINITY_DN432_c0_g1~~TRINITY_DN432_c0_g1_i1.p1  ORF type:complete len:111 (+),score=26.48 TRINITY_DN432_c0_g1_i1:40-333(+)
MGVAGSVAQAGAERTTKNQASKAKEKGKYYRDVMIDEADKEKNGFERACDSVYNSVVGLWDDGNQQIDDYKRNKQREKNKEFNNQMKQKYGIHHTRY